MYSELSVLLDLKHLLVEAKQEVPVFLQTLEGSAGEVASNKPEDKGCAYCSGLGHRISNCPKLENVQSKVVYLFFSTIVFFSDGTKCTTTRFPFEWWRLVMEDFCGSGKKFARIMSMWLILVIGHFYFFFVFLI